MSVVASETGLKASFARIRAMLFHPSELHARSADRPAYERLAVPFTFPPQLSVVEALCATAGAFVRIVLGSMLFAAWGAASFLAWAKPWHLFWRLLALVLLLCLFLSVAAAVMLSISWAVRAITPRR
jgi:hypothetical protein